MSAFSHHVWAAILGMSTERRYWARRIRYCGSTKSATLTVSFATNGSYRRAHLDHGSTNFLAFPATSCAVVTAARWLL